MAPFLSLSFYLLFSKEDYSYFEAHLQGNIIDAEITCFENFCLNEIVISALGLDS